MMSDVESKELLQAKALGCLDPEDDALITKLMKEDENFPWQELGHYQNLVAFLPTILEIEIPEPEVKDNVARKLYELGEKVKARKEEEEVKQNTIAEEPELDKIEEDGFILEEEPIEKADIPEVTEDPVNVGKTNSGILIKEHGAPLQKPLSDGKKVIQEPLMKKQQGAPQTKTSRTHPKKEFEQKSDESYFSKFSSGSRVGESSTSKSGLILTIILFAVTLLALLFVYFTLSSDIQENRDKIDRLEKQIGAEINLENITTHKSFNT
jgi:hypothetical protein